MWTLTLSYTGGPPPCHPLLEDLGLAPQNCELHLLQMFSHKATESGNTGCNSPILKSSMCCAVQDGRMFAVLCSCDPAQLSTTGFASRRTPGPVCSPSWSPLLIPGDAGSPLSGTRVCGAFRAPGIRRCLAVYVWGQCFPGSSCLAVLHGFSWPSAVAPLCVPRSVHPSVEDAQGFRFWGTVVTQLRMLVHACSCSSLGAQERIVGPRV